jgi:hypothetical protein
MIFRYTLGWNDMDCKKLNITVSIAMFYRLDDGSDAISIAITYSLDHGCGCGRARICPWLPDGL